MGILGLVPMTAFDDGYADAARGKSKSMGEAKKIYATRDEATSYIWGVYQYQLETNPVEMISEQET